MDGKKKKKKTKPLSKKSQRKSVVEYSSESESEGEVKSEPEEGIFYANFTYFFVHILCFYPQFFFFLPNIVIGCAQ